jgi:Tol biopolymer transport system component
MTGFERIEHRLPDLMADLASATVPDYVDDMLERASHTRQKPAWASLERWLPVDITAQASTLRGRTPALRPIVVFAILAVAIGAGAILYAGSQRQDELPPPFGLAGNGALLVGTADGDIAALDPVTGATTPVIDGPTQDAGPTFSPDGRRFVFARVNGGTGNMFVANADGSELVDLGPIGGDVWWEWSPESDRLVLAGLDPAHADVVTMIDVATGARHEVDLGPVAFTPVWRPGHDQLIFVSYDDQGVVASLYVVNADGSGLMRIETARGALASTALSPDGSKLAYATWGTGSGSTERIHVIDIDSGNDVTITPDANDGYLWQSPSFTPDGRSVVASRFTPNGGPFRLAVIPIDGSGAPREIGPERVIEGGGADFQISPDGTTLFVQYRDGETQEPTSFVVDVATGDSREIQLKPEGISWQRLPLTH